MGSDIQEVPLAQIQESELLRLRQPPYPNIDELAEQIRTHGQTTPMFVNETEHSLYTLISGYRRNEALRRLKATTALVRIFNLDDEAAYELAVSENQHRDALSEIERADICLRLQAAGRSQPEIAERMGWTTDRSVRRYLQLAQHATPPLREVLQARRINFRSAFVFLTHGIDLPEKRQREILLHATNTDISSADLERMLLRAKGAKKPKLPPADPMKRLKNGGFILRSTRVDPDDPASLTDSIAVLKAALRKARRLERAQKKRQTPEDSAEASS